MQWVRRRRDRLLVLLVILLLCPAIAYAADHKVIPKKYADVVAAGGASGTDATSTYQFHDTVAQDPIGVRADGPGFAMYDGFWAVAAGNAPTDVTPPDISISVFQNPLLTNHLDILVAVEDENEILSESLFCQIVCGSDSDTVDLKPQDEYRHIYRGDFDLYETGTCSITVSVSDIAQNPGFGTHTFGASLILATTGGVCTSPDSNCILSLPGGSVTRDIYALTFERVTDPAGAFPVYDIRPTGLALAALAEISISYDDADEPEHLCIAQVNGKKIVPATSYIDKAGGRIVAYVDRIGLYTLISRPDEALQPYGGEGLVVIQGVPNPFRTHTRIEFWLGRSEHIQVEMFDVGGRKIKTLLDQSLPPGHSEVLWDGTDGEGHSVTSGVYLFRITSGSGTETGKLVHMR
jgi:hypothetical protein